MIAPNQNYYEENLNRIDSDLSKWITSFMKGANLDYSQVIGILVIIALIILFK